MTGRTKDEIDSILLQLKETSGKEHYHLGRGDSFKTVCPEKFIGIAVGIFGSTDITDNSYRIGYHYGINTSYDYFVEVDSAMHVLNKRTQPISRKIKL